MVLQQASNHDLDDSCPNKRPEWVLVWLRTSDKTIPLHARTEKEFHRLKMLSTKEKNAEVMSYTILQAALLLVKLGEPFLGRLQPVLYIVVVATFDAMEGVDHSSLVTCVFLTLVQKIAVNQDKCACFHLS